MPAKSRAQAQLMGAAEHGADFPMARKVRSSMSLSQMADFAKTPRATLPAHVAAPKMPTEKMPGRPMPKMHPHSNLGKYLHPKKGGR